MRFAILLMLGLLGAPLARAQVFERGYLVLQTGDTVRGEVENAFWAEPPTAVRFRAAASAAVRKYPARQLRSVGLASGRRLQHELLPLDRSAEINISYLTTSKEVHQQPDSVLADVLATGRVTLLGVVLHDNKHFFLRRAGQPWVELAGRNYLVSGQGPTRVADANNYQGQLRLYFIDCPALIRQLGTLPYTTEALQYVVETYNQGCSEDMPAFRPTSSARHPGAALRWGLLLGARYNSLRLASNGTLNQLQGVNVDGQVHLQGGGYFSLLSPGRRVALYTGLQASGVGHRQPVLFAGTAQAGSFEWHGALVALQVGLRYVVVPQHRKQLFLGAGYEFNTFWNLTSEVTYNGRVDGFAPRFYGSPLPYVEVGLNCERVTLALNSRLYASDQVAIFDTGTYRYQPWSLSLTGAYRLNRNTDAPSAAAAQ